MSESNPYADLQMEIVELFEKHKITSCATKVGILEQCIFALLMTGAARSIRAIVAGKGPTAPGRGKE